MPGGLNDALRLHQHHRRHRRHQQQEAHHQQGIEPLLGAIEQRAKHLGQPTVQGGGIGRGLEAGEGKDQRSGQPEAAQNSRNRHGREQILAHVGIGCREQHDHEQEQHHDGPTVHDDLGHGHEAGFQRDIHARDHHEVGDQGQRRVYRVAQAHYQKAGSNEQHEG